MLIIGVIKCRSYAGWGSAGKRQGEAEGIAAGRGMSMVVDIGVGMRRGETVSYVASMIGGHRMRLRQF